MYETIREELPKHLELLDEDQQVDLIHQPRHGRHGRQERLRRRQHRPRLAPLCIPGQRLDLVLLGGDLGPRNGLCWLVVITFSPASVHAKALPRCQANKMAVSSRLQDLLDWVRAVRHVEVIQPSTLATVLP